MKDFSNILTKDFLEEEYINKAKSSIDIAKELNCSKPTIFKYLKKNNICIRTISESRILKTKLGRHTKKFIVGQISDNNWLYLQYVINKKSAKDISKLAKVNIRTVYNRLYLFKIPMRNHSEYTKLYYENGGQSPMLGKKRPDLIERNKKLTFPKELNGNWKGGISKFPYSFEFNKSLKEQIRERDSWKCQNCGLTNEEHLITYDESLPIHHIDYNKMNCQKDNLITTCKQCNSRANFNRGCWIEFYKNKIAQLNKEATKNESL
jgi:hypothetical protein